MLVVSWQLSYCIFCIKRVFLKPFGKSHLDIYVPKRHNKFRKCVFLCALFDCYILTQSLDELMSVTD